MWNCDGLRLGGDTDGTEATMRHTFPSIDDYVITAVICRETDMSEYEETDNLTVDT